MISRSSVPRPGPRSAMSAPSPPGHGANGSHLKKKAHREGRTLLFLDETGHSFRQRPGTTWARRGATPLLRRVSKRREVSSIVAVTPDGRLYARHVRGSVSSPTVILALRHFRRKVGAPLLVVRDRLNAHRAERAPSSPRSRGTSRWPTCRPTPRSSTPRSRATPASSAPWRTRYPAPPTTCTVSPGASSAVPSNDRNWSSAASGTQASQLRHFGEDH